jgi:hypothetical protein
MPNAPALGDEELRARVRQRIEQGRLPVVVSTELWAGYGTGAPCSGCTEPIAPNNIEFEVQHLQGYAELVFHARCHVLWQAECIWRTSKRRGVQVPKAPDSSSAKDE